MSGTFDVGITAQIVCVEREIKYRERCYPRWVAAGTLNATSAQRELEQMRAVLLTLTTLRDCALAEAGVPTQQAGLL